MSDGDQRDGDCIDFNSVRVNKSDEMIHSELRSLYTYWDALRAGRKTPLRSDIDPRDMDCDARNLFILENLGRGNIRFRLAGTAIVDAFGMELRGMNARAIMSTGSRESFTALITETLEDPGVGYARLRNAADDAVVWEISLLPLRSDFGMIDRVIGCLHPLSGKNGRRGQSLLRFRIEQMSVEPINATVRDIDLPTPIEGFADPGRTFEHKEVELPEARPRFQTIAGGRTGTDDEERPNPTRGHLRLVED
ncbi:MAG: PAS domain-containing protein [Pseudomonadota bacterium]